MKNIIVVTGASSGMGKDFVKQIEKKQKVDEIWVIARREDRLIALKDEQFDFTKPLTLYHPIERWKKTTFTDYVVRELPICVIKNGKLVADMPKVKDIAAYAKTEMDSFWDEYKRIDQPEIYKVDLSDGLYELKHDMLDRIRRGEKLN